MLVVSTSKKHNERGCLQYQHDLLLDRQQQVLAGFLFRKFGPSLFCGAQNRPFVKRRTFSSMPLSPSLSLYLFFSRFMPRSKKDIATAQIPGHLLEAVPLWNAISVHLEQMKRSKGPGKVQRESERRTVPKCVFQEFQKSSLSVPPRVPFLFHVASSLREIGEVPLILAAWIILDFASLRIYCTSP